MNIQKQEMQHKIKWINRINLKQQVRINIFTHATKSMRWYWRLQNHSHIRVELTVINAPKLLLEMIFLKDSGIACNVRADQDMTLAGIVLIKHHYWWKKMKKSLKLLTMNFQNVSNNWKQKETHYLICTIKQFLAKTIAQNNLQIWTKLCKMQW